MLVRRCVVLLGLMVLMSCHSKQSSDAPSARQDSPVSVEPSAKAGPRLDDADGGGPVAGPFSGTSCWTITQVQELGFLRLGDLRLNETVDGAVGWVDFREMPRADARAVAVGAEVRMQFHFPGDVVGRYQASFDETRTRMLNGVTVGTNGGSARWSAEKVDCPR